jgi:hypothetical protein
MYGVVSLVKRQNKGVDALHADRLDRYVKKKKKKKEETEET